MRGTRGDQAGTRVSKFAALEAMRNESPSSPWATATSSASKCSTNGSAAVFIRRTWNYGSEGHAVPRRGCRPGPRGVWAVAPAVSTPHCLRGTRQDLPCTSPGEPRTPAGSPVRAPRWSSAEVFSRHQRGGREGERPRRCRPRADSIRAGVRSKAHRFAVAGRAGCTGSRSVAVTAGHQGDEHVPRALLVPGRGEDHEH